MNKQTIKRYRKELTELCSKLDRLNKYKYYLMDKIKDFEGDSNIIRISDHIMVRYLQRVLKLNLRPIKKEVKKRYGIISDYLVLDYMSNDMGMDLDTIHDEILKIVSNYDNIDKKYKIHHCGFIYVIDDKTAVTVMEG